MNKEICKIQKNVIKRWIKKNKVEYILRNSKSLNLICSSDDKQYIEKAKKSYEKWYNAPLFNVFKLGSGEYQILLKEKYWIMYWNYNNISYDWKNWFKIYDIKIDEYYKTLDEACEMFYKINDVLKLFEDRKVRKQVDCI